MMASVEEAKATKNQAKNKDDTQQTMTINFAPETEYSSKPKNMEEYIRTYFEGINGINRRIIAEERKIIAQNRNSWPSLTVEERDQLLNDRFISADIRQKYNTSEKYWKEKTPWQPEQIISSEDLKPCLRVERTDSMSLNDSFSKPFQWATKSQRNLRFPVIKQEKPKIIEERPEQTESSSKKSEETNMPKPVEGDETVQKLNNVEQSIKEKQIKTKNKNIKGNITNSKPSNSKMVEEKPKTSTSSNNENLKQSDEQEATSEQSKADGNEYLDGSKNIFEFLQSWNP